MNSTLYVGLDLGTTNSAVAVFDGDTVVVARNADGASITPSVVRIDSKGRVTVGDRARRLRDSDPANVRGEFKRLMGAEHTLAFAGCGVTRRPEELSAEILRSLRADVERQFGVAPLRAVITVPALFELPQVRATSEAARLAGFEQVEMLQEPVASAIAAGWRAGADDSAAWLVYDLGGGTFDVTLLESQEGLLRVVGHDGDNFLGGKDIDNALLALCLERLEADDGVTIDRAVPAGEAAVQRLRFAVEEAKIALSSVLESAVTVPSLVVPTADGSREIIEVELTLTRADLDAAVAPLVDRTVRICQRLITRHGMASTDLGRVVLVGGPTAMPIVRARVAESVGPLATAGHDPMTLVAQGAALHAAAMNLPAVASRDGADAANTPKGPAVWLQYQALSADATPWLVGRLMEDASHIAQVRLRRPDGWTSEVVTPSADRTFSVTLAVRPRAKNTFHVEGLSSGGWIALAPPTIVITHGIQLGDPPLARAIGLALADNTVRVFLERGVPLPMRRTHVVRTVRAVGPGAEGHALLVPIVQGDFTLAHLCRLVGRLEIDASTLKGPLPAASAVEVTVDVDRGGQLTVSARIPALGQSFDRVATLVSPRIPKESLDEALDALQDRLGALRGAAFRARDAKLALAVAPVESLLVELERDVDAAHRGDVDSLERARRGLTDADGMLAEHEAAVAWPALVEQVRWNVAWYGAHVSDHATESERHSFDAAVATLERAIGRHDAREVGRQRDVIRRLGHVAYFRSPGAWDDELDAVEGHIADSTDPPKVQRLVQEARKAQERHDATVMQRTIRESWRYMPPDAADIVGTFESGVR